MPETGWFRTLKRRLRVARARREVEARCVAPIPHGLDRPLILSLTSYPPRFGVLALTLTALLRQTVRPDRTILWLAGDDMPLLPPEVTALTAQGLEIRETRDLRSYKKIVPALLAFPEAFIATADDDLAYPATWAEDLVRTAHAHPGRIVAHRAHRILRNAAGAMLSYELWQKNIAGAVEGPEVFATGAGGVIYPPGSLHPDTVDSDLFGALAPSADDIWLYWMARRQGSLVRHVGPKVRIVEWTGSQVQNLRGQNRGAAGQNGNDRAIAALIRRFGDPGRAAGE